MTMLPFAFNISTSIMNEMQFFIHWQKEKDWQERLVQRAVWQIRQLRGQGS